MTLAGKWRAVAVTGLVLVLAALCALAAVGAVTLWRSHKAPRPPPTQEEAEPAPFVAPEPEPYYYTRIPQSKLPGPTRRYTPAVFVLNDENSQTMRGHDDLANERWCDIAGNFYSSELISNFRYAAPGPSGPIVRVHVRPRAPTLTGRIEAHGLKPNFLYQIKLRGVFSDRAAFERIGYIGRWRLPGLGTNYTDDDYQWYPFKESVEAYVLFDFFATDRNGDGARDFALDSCLHVLFNGTRQGTADVEADDLVPVIVDPSNTNLYARPKINKSVELIWAQRESMRYRSADQVVRLPPGHYNAELVLTEESFHSSDSDGGYWATVCLVPISFTVTPEETAAAPE